MQTIREAGQISFGTFSERISGHTITFLASFIGYFWLCVRFPIMLLGLPLVGLGFLALFGLSDLKIFLISDLIGGIIGGFLILGLASILWGCLKGKRLEPDEIIYQFEVKR